MTKKWGKNDCKLWTDAWLQKGSERQKKRRKTSFQGDFEQGTIYDQIGCVGI